MQNYVKIQHGRIGIIPVICTAISLVMVKLRTVHAIEGHDRDLFLVLTRSRFEKMLFKKNNKKSCFGSLVSRLGPKN